MDLIRLIRNWRLFGFKKLLYLPHILEPVEKRFFILLFVLALASGAVLLMREYRAFTIQVPDIGGTFKEGMLREPRLINPLYAAHDTDRDISRLVYSGLLTYSENGNIINDLAEKYEISENGKTYTLTLRENALWHDAKKVSANDVIFTVQTLQNPQYKSVYRANWLGVNAEKIDERTIKFTLRTAYAPFIENLTLGILPKHIWESAGPERTLIHENNLKPIGSGPFKFKEFNQNKEGEITSYILERNRNYYREGPYIKTVNFLFFKTTDELLIAWRRKTIDGFSIAGEKSATEVVGRGKDILRTIPMPRIVGLFFNEKQAAPLADKKVRSAIAYALQKEELVKIPAGGVVAADYPIPFFPIQAADKFKVLTFDPSAAVKLLEESGWKDENNNGIREKKEKNKGKETIKQLRLTLTTSDWPELILMAEKIKEMLGAVGIEISIEVKSFAELETSVIRPRNFDMLLFGEVYGYEPDPFAFWHSSQIKDPGLNIALYANKKADALLEEARRTSDKELRSKKFEEFSKILSADIPAVFLYTQNFLYVLPPNIQGAEIERIGLPADRFNEINKWYIKTRRVFQ